MTIKNNWLSSSLVNRSPTNLCDFNITVNPYEFELDTFKNNSIRVATEIAEAHDKLYLLYSGGLDSEYVLKVFIENNLPITPVIINTPFNKEEIKYAYKYLSNNNLKPYVLTYNEEQFLSISKKISHEKAYYSFITSIQLDVCDKISELNGILVTGSGDFDPTYDSKTNSMNILINEFMFYVEYHPGNHVGSFYCYDLALKYSMLNELTPNTDPNMIKSRLYNLEYRKKMPYSAEFIEYFKENMVTGINKYKLELKLEDFKASLSKTESTTFI